MIRLFAILLIALPIAAHAQERPTPQDIKQFNVWAKAVVDEFLFYRTIENDLLNAQGKPDSEQKYLTRRLHDMLRPPDDVLTRIANQHFEKLEGAEACRDAIRMLQYALNASITAKSLRDRHYQTEAREYIEQARTCEKKIKQKPYRSRFREAIDAMPAP